MHNTSDFIWMLPFRDTIHIVIINFVESAVSYQLSASAYVQWSKNEYKPY